MIFQNLNRLKQKKSAESETIKKVESKPKVNKRKQPIIDFKWKRRNTVKSNKECLIISVFGTTHGAGVTNMTASLAEYFSEKNGKKYWRLIYPAVMNFDIYMDVRNIRT